MAWNVLSHVYISGEHPQYTCISINKPLSRTAIVCMYCIHGIELMCRSHMFTRYLKYMYNDWVPWANVYKGRSLHFHRICLPYTSSWIVIIGIIKHLGNKVSIVTAMQLADFSHTHSECIIRGADVSHTNSECITRGADVSRTHSECITRSADGKNDQAGLP